MNRFPICLTPQSRQGRARFTFAVRCALALGALVGACLPAACATVVHYARPESHIDERASYPIALLKLSLQKSGADYQLAPSVVQMQQGRSLRFLEQGKHIDVVWTVTTIERERQFLPIRIPIDRGLIGWRLLLIQSKREAVFASVRQRDALAILVAGQGHDWPDTEVLRANQLKVTTSSTYEGLFKMLALGHIDYFPRSVSEIWPELDARTGRGLAVEPGLVLHYPEALYFFVNRNNQALAGAIDKGLRAAIEDGTMERLFQRFYGAAIRRANLAGRTRITLHNPLLPASAPTADAALWFAPPASAKTSQ